jgi:UDP-2,3-diacylglucosamine pyrophosphatase LpxH
MMPVPFGTRTLIASDWHLSRYSSAEASTLALAFLERARDAGDEVILNGDVFEGLFEPVAVSEDAHPHVVSLMEAMRRGGQLRRTEGNHDPGVGPEAIVLEHPTLRSVLVTHGHAADPLSASPIGRLGDSVSRRFGWIPAVRLAARLAEQTASLTAHRIERVFSAHCRDLVTRHRSDMGVFGHIHRQYLVAGDRYANAGHLSDARLEFIEIDRDGARASRLELAAL